MASAFAPQVRRAREKALLGAPQFEGEIGIGPETTGKWDPLGLSTRYPSEYTQKWFRAAELKHGRVAMLATVGWLVGVAGLGKIPFPLEGGLAPLSTDPLEANAQLWSIGGGVAWAQIYAAIGAVEITTELAIKPHYMTKEGGDGYINLLGYEDTGKKRPVTGRTLSEMKTSELKNGRLAMRG